MANLNLTRDEWKTFKVENGLTKSSFFTKANVGPLVDAFHKAGERWEAEDGMTGDGRKFLKATEKLSKAFSKFIRNKAAKQELTADALRQINRWQRELQETYDQVLDLLRLQSKGSGQVRDAEILGKKLDKMFNF